MFYNFFPVSFLESSIMMFSMPMNLSYFWNFGSMLGFILTIQLFTGYFLSFFYLPSVEFSFYFVSQFLENDVFFGFFFRMIHLNFASFFFIFIYLHLFRNLFFKSFQKSMVWFTGIFLLMFLMLTAFLGYVLPWGQMSFWGATVITSFLTVIPFIGKTLVYILWSSFFVGQSMQSFFFSMHFLFPMILLVLVFFHLIYLHSVLSSNKNFSKNSFNKKFFNSMLLNQDLLNFLILFLSVEFMFITPFFFDDEENAKFANESSSPLHIKPEWYFLFAYAILRSIPNKLGGVIAMGASLLFFLLFLNKKSKKMSKMFFSFIVYFFFVANE